MENQYLAEYKAGDVIALKSLGTKEETARFFFESRIRDELFQRMKGKSFKKDCTVPREDLRYLRVLHWGKEGPTVGEMVCHESVSRPLLEIFMELFQEKYPIERMRLIDDYDADDERSMAANNSSCFNFRRVPGKEKLSHHSLGIAVDINPFYNPYVRTDKEGAILCSPEGSEPYGDREKDFIYKIEKGDICVRTFAKYGFQWGGDWTTCKDYQHFSTTGG